MAASVSDYFKKLGSASSLVNSPKVSAARSGGGTTLTVDNCNWDTTTGKVFATYKVDTSNHVVANSETIWVGVVNSSTSIGSLSRVAGASDTGNAIGDIVELLPASKWANDLMTGLLVQHKQDGTHTTVTTDTLVASGNITAANFIQSGGAAANGWTTGLATPNTVTALGNRSYSMVFNSTDLTGTVSNGMRLRTTRTVAAPTQCTSLNGTTQYYSRASASVAGMTFTDDFVVSIRAKIPSVYPASTVTLASRWNGTSGWTLDLTATGQLQLIGFNGGAGNYSYVISAASVPLDQWIHIAAQLDMSTFTATPTTSYVMIDGLDTPCSVVRAGTNPTALVQAGNLEIGSRNGGLQPFPGKIAQVAIYSAKVTQANIRATISQTLSGSETSLISAYSFNNSINDLSSNANNLTANGSAVATNADSPFGGQSDGSISSTLDYGIIQSAAFSTDTTLVVQVPEGCTIPTTGGVSAVSYSAQRSPYGFPSSSVKWELEVPSLVIQQSANVAALNIWYAFPYKITVPIGAWDIEFQSILQMNQTVAGALSAAIGLFGTTPTNGVYATDLTGNIFSGVSVNDIMLSVSRSKRISVATATDYVFYGQVRTNTSATILYVRGDFGGRSVIKVKNAYL